MPCGCGLRVGPRNHILDGGPGRPAKEQVWEGKGRPVVKCRDCMPWAVQKNGWTDWDAVWVVDSGGSMEAFVRWGCTLASMCGGDAAFLNYFDQLLLLGHIAVLRTYMRPVVRDRVAWSVCLSVGRSVACSEPCKNGWTDWNVLWSVDLGRPKKPCIRWGSRSPYGKGQFWGERSCRPTCHPSRRRMSSSTTCAVVALSPTRNKWIRRHEGCDAAFRQITLTTCYYCYYM